ncbi:MAG: c-type cytochrome [Planctomycetales bacterium]|nr:c-type cytochrome [Planctomycetales bacterium]
MNRVFSVQTLRRIAISTLLPLATFGTTLAFMSVPPNTRGIDLDSGGELFSVHCGSCHFAKVGFPAHHGPNLHDIGNTGALRRPNQSAAEYILESILDPAAYLAPSGRPGMPANVAAELAPEEIRNIVGYLASRGAFPDYDEILGLEIPDRRSAAAEPTLVRHADMELAERVLREKGACIQCHSLDNSPEGAVFAPGLFGVGLGNAKAVRDSIIDPHRDIHPRYKMATVLLASGQIVSGNLVSRDDDRLTLCTKDSQNRLTMKEISLADIEHNNGQPVIKESQVSLMPEGFDKSLTEQEIDAVINLIRQLN